MIKNDQQYHTNYFWSWCKTDGRDKSAPLRILYTISLVNWYQITREWVSRFEQSLHNLGNSADGDEQSRRAHDIQRSAMQSKLADLQQELADYDALRSNGRGRFKATSLDEVPALLIKVRIAAGLSEQQLAATAGIDEQQLHHYEDTDYDAAPFAVLLDVVEALGLNITVDASLPGAAHSTLSNQPVGSKTIANGH